MNTQIDPILQDKLNRHSEFEKIAKKHLLINTLAVRGRDSLDFHDCGVVGIQRALQEAYDLGKKEAKQGK